MKRTFKLFLSIIKVILLYSCSIIFLPKSSAQTSFTPEKKFILGGQFKDLFLPVPANGKLKNKNIWGGDNVLPRDVKNGVEDSKWCYWGGNPVKGKDNKYHVAICRWKEETGHWGWKKSEVAHAVSKKPTGPYKVTNTIVEQGHNPEVIALKNGTYILHIIGGKVFTSESLAGPWNLLGKLEIDTRGHKGLSHLQTNLTGLERTDGSFLFFTKRGDVMISNNGILGSFKMVSAHNYNRYSGYPEDPVIWKSRHQYHVVYNHAIEKKSVHMRSLDGIHWIVEPGLAYDKTIFRYTDGTKNEWVKFERPKVIQDHYGRATHMTLGVIDVEKKEDLGNDKHSSKNIVIPLVTERLIEIETSDIENWQNNDIQVIIKSEKKFNPLKEVDVSSLILGPSNHVNYGIGVKPIKSMQQGKDLIVFFSSEGLEIHSKHYDLKLLGKTKKDKLFFGYALLPGFTEEPASLVTEPIKIEEKNGDKILKTTVENFGLKTSKACEVKIIASKGSKKEILKTYKIPALKPYGAYKITLPVQSDKMVEYETLIINNKKTTTWNKVDDKHYTVVFKGDWNKNTKGKDIYMGSENVSAQKGASATFFFNGTQARCYGNISSSMGSCDVFIDDAFVERIDCYFRANIHNTVIYQTPILEQGLHKLELRITGIHYKQKEKGSISIDAFDYSK